MIKENSFFTGKTEENPDVEKELLIKKKTKVKPIRHTEFSKELLVEDFE